MVSFSFSQLCISFAHGNHLQFSSNCEIVQLTDFFGCCTYYLNLRSFEDDKLALYDDSVDIALTLSPPPDMEDYSNRRIDIKIRLQACDDEICLPPEDVVLECLGPGNH